MPLPVPNIGGGSEYGSEPAPPAYRQTGNKNIDAAESAWDRDWWAQQQVLNANRPNYSDPYGSNNWEQTQGFDANGNPTTDWTNTVSLNPTLQAALDAQQGLVKNRSELGAEMFDRVGGELSQAPDWSQLQGWGNVPGAYQLDSANLNPNLDYSGAPGLGDESRYRSYDFEGLSGWEDPNALRSRVEDEYYGKASSRLDPAFEQGRKDLEATMRSQGLQPGDRQWDQRLGEFTQGRTDAYGQAQFDATRAGGEEFDRLFSSDLARRQQQMAEIMRGTDSYNEANQDQFSERVARRNMDTGETRDAWQGYNQMQALQGSENRATAGQNFGQEMQQSQYANSLREQQMVMELQQRGASLNEINALLSGQQVQLPGQPSGGSATAPATAEFQDAKYINDRISALDRSNDIDELNSIFNAGGTAAGLPGQFGTSWKDIWSDIFGKKEDSKKDKESDFSWPTMGGGGGGDQ